jgi:hypothetical protein
VDIGIPLREFVIEPIEEPIPETMPSDPVTREVPDEHNTGHD